MRQSSARVFAWLMRGNPLPSRSGFCHLGPDLSRSRSPGPARLLIAAAGREPPGPSPCGGTMCSPEGPDCHNAAACASLGRRAGLSDRSSGLLLLRTSDAQDCCSANLPAGETQRADVSYPNDVGSFVCGCSPRAIPFRGWPGSSSLGRVRARDPAHVRGVPLWPSSLGASRLLGTVHRPTVVGPPRGWRSR